MDLDKLNNQSSLEAVRVAYGVVDLLQHSRPEAQAVAIALLFRAVLNAHKVDQSRVLTIVDNMTRREDENQATFRALALYAKHELT